MKEIFAQEGTPWNYPKRYSFNDNLIELRNNMEIGMGGPLMGCLFINGTEASLLNGKKMYRYVFGGPIILTDKYIYIPLFEAKNESRKRPSSKDRILSYSGFYISRVSYSSDIEILSNKFPIVHLVKKKDNTLFFMDKYKGEIKSIEIPPEE